MDPFAKLATVPRRPPPADLLAAGALLVWALLEALLNSGPGPLVGRIAFAILITAPLAFRRQAPGVVAGVIAVAIVAWALHATTHETGIMPFPSVLLAGFSVACYARRASVAVAGGLALFAAMLTALEATYYSEGPASPKNVAVLSLFLGGAWAAGWLVRQRAAQARRAVAESGELARAAVSEERTRIARELHDVVAHSVSIIAVQAGAAEELLEREPTRARAHLASVRRTAREAMSEMRRVLEVLRTDEPRYAPQPGLARLPELLEDVRAAHVPVEFVEQGERPHLAPGLDLVAFRVIQESLTNVRKHATGASARVLLRYAPKSLELEVSNTAAPPGADPAPGLNGAGHGLIGMRERVLLFGGSFEAAPSSDGSFRVRATLPLEEVSG
jgi:signal transduction histidine kinase